VLAWSAHARQSIATMLRYSDTKHGSVLTLLTRCGVDHER
jgi:hypothetical protein